MCSARRGIDLRADAGANNPTGAVDKVTIDTRTMVRIFFEYREITARCARPGTAHRAVISRFSKKIRTIVRVSMVTLSTAPVGLFAPASARRSIPRLAEHIMSVRG